MCVLLTRVRCALFAQACYRGRIARIFFYKMKKAIGIMQECEMLYLNNPAHIPYKVRQLH